MVAILIFIAKIKDCVSGWSIDYGVGEGVTNIFVINLGRSRFFFPVGLEGGGVNFFVHHIHHMKM